jgi:hypothetical protein
VPPEAEEGTRDILETDGQELRRADEPLAERSRLLESPMSAETHDDKRLLAGMDEAGLGVADWEGSDVPPVRDDLRALRDIVEGTARGTGQEFFRSLVRPLASAIDVPYAVVAEFADVKTAAPPGIKRIMHPPVKRRAGRDGR